MKQSPLSFLCIWINCCFGLDSYFGIEQMSLEEKAGQVLVVHFHGETINDAAKTLIQQVNVGGIIYYNWSNGLHSPEQVSNLSRGLQQLAQENRLSIPLLIATDQEGGVVSRLQSGFTYFPGNRALGETHDPQLAQAAAYAMGQELQAVGINMNFAPVVDVNSNPKNPIIGIRSFGDHPEVVTAFGQQALEGFKQAHVIATLKHFPGYGDVSVDPHEDLPIIRTSKEELEKVELLPFTRLAASADAMMTAHILVPALDTENCATLSAQTLKYLRETIGFQGVIVADSLVMDGVLKKCHSVDEAAVAALNAGCDLLILGGKLLNGEHMGFELTIADVQRIHRAIVAAVKNGRIPETTLNAAVAHILKLKDKYLKDKRTPLQDGHINSAKHRALAQQIASLALRKTEKKTSRIAHLGDKKILIIAPTILKAPLYQTSLLNIGKSTSSCFFNTLSPSDNEIKTALEQADTADVVIMCSYNAWAHPSAACLTHALLDTNKPLILLSLRDPWDSTLFPEADLIFTSFSPTIPSLQAICDELAKRK